MKAGRYAAGFMLAVCSTASACLVVEVSLESDKPTIRVGETATVTVRLDAGDERVYSWGGDLVYDDQIVRVSNISLSSEWRQGESRDGDTIAAFSPPGRDHLSDLFTFQVTGLREGVVNFSIARTNGDTSESWVSKRGELLEPTFLSTAVQVIPIPEPFTVSGIALMGSIICLQRRRSPELA